MKEFKKTLEVMKKHAIISPWQSEVEFKQLMAKRGLQFKGIIEGDCAQHEEVYAGNTYAVIVQHDLITNEYRIR